MTPWRAPSADKPLGDGSLRELVRERPCGRLHRESSSSFERPRDPGLILEHDTKQLVVAGRVPRAIQTRSPPPERVRVSVGGGRRAPARHGGANDVFFPRPRRDDVEDVGRLRPTRRRHVQLDLGACVRDERWVVRDLGEDSRKRDVATA